MSSIEYSTPHSSSHFASAKGTDAVLERSIPEASIIEALAIKKVNTIPAHIIFEQLFLQHGSQPSHNLQARQQQSMHVIMQSVRSQSGINFGLLINLISISIIEQ